MLHAPMPRTLRVRGTLSVGTLRLPVRSLMVWTVIGALAIAAIGYGHTPILPTALLALVSAGVASILADGRWWGLPVPTVIVIIIRHMRRPRILTWSMPSHRIDGTPRSASGAAVRARWTPGETDDA